MTTALMVAFLLVSSLWKSGFPETIRTENSLQDNRQEAERLWELAIAAKGGRERLYAARNLQISIREKVWYAFRRFPHSEEHLYVFPNKYWSWIDQRPTILGLGVRMYNGDRDINLWYAEDGKESDHGKGVHVGRPFEYVKNAALIPMYDAQLEYFMETQWVKPVPVSVQQAKLDGKAVDVVQTIVKGYPTRDGTNEERVAFWLDRKTHLPLQIIYHTAGIEYPGKTSLSDYVDVAGIQIPSKLDGLRSNYQINVDYDEEIFIREPNADGGIKQWSKK